MNTREHPDAYYEGRASALKGVSPKDCPYKDLQSRHWWLAGHGDVESGHESKLECAALWIVAATPEQVETLKGMGICYSAGQNAISDNLLIDMSLLDQYQDTEVQKILGLSAGEAADVWGQVVQVIPI